MRPLITVTAVVILHLCVLAVLVGVNGCRSTSGHEVESPADLAAFSGGLRRAQLPTKVGAAPAPVTPAPVAVAPVPTVATPPPSPLVGSAKAAPGETITVMKGEGLFAIAKRQGISVGQLAAANGLPLNATLREGQRLRIPAPGQSVSAPKAATKSAPKAAPKAAAPAPAPAPAPEPFKLTPLGAPAAPKPAASAPAPAPAAAPSPKPAN